MPKNRERLAQKGAKSKAIRTKFKIGGRKSNKGAKQMADEDLVIALGKCRKRDQNKLRRIFEERMSSDRLTVEVTHINA